MEDQVERAGFGDTIMAMVAEGVGRDIEELMIQADSDDTEIGHGEGVGSYLRLFDGWIKQCLTTTGANVVDSVNDGDDYQRIFNKLLTSLPDRYKRDVNNMRFYVPPSLGREVPG